MSGQSLEKEWRNMITISHDFFHQWRRTVLEFVDEEKAEQMVQRFWELVGAGTAEAFRRRKPASLRAVVDLVARSSAVMGEDVTVREEGGECYLIHTACPWLESYRRAGLGGSCRPGCDRWFTSTLVSLPLPYRVETLGSLPGGDPTCTRRFYRKEDDLAPAKG